MVIVTTLVILMTGKALWSVILSWFKSNYMELREAKGGGTIIL
jgi:hypothetical protein